MKENENRQRIPLEFIARIFYHIESNLAAAAAAAAGNGGGMQCTHFWSCHLFIARCTFSRLNRSNGAHTDTQQQHQ